MRTVSIAGRLMVNEGGKHCWAANGEGSNSARWLMVTTVSSAGQVKERTERIVGQLKLTEGSSAGRIMVRVVSNAGEEMVKAVLIGKCF